MNTTNASRSLRRLGAALAVSALAGLATPGWTQPMQGAGMHHPRGGPMHQGRHGGPHEGLGGLGLSGRALEAVKATPEQRDRIRQIFEAARRDMAGQRNARRALNEEARRLFSQPEVDAAAAETLRQKMAAQHEQVSKRRMQAMVEAARVLTPEQRRQLADLDKRRGEMRERHRRERESLAPGKS